MVNQQFAMAVHLMTSLAHNPDVQQNSERLAQSTRTNAVVIRRLLAKLAKAGLVKTQRGKSGGVQLCRKASAITLADIYRAVSSSRLLNCSEKPALRECPVSCSMSEILNDVLDGVEAAGVNYLSKIRVSDLAKRIDS